MRSRALESKLGSLERYWRAIFDSDSELFVFKGESMKDWITLLILSLKKYSKARISPHRLRDFLLTVVTLALIAYGFWMLKLLEQLIKIMDKP
jgi:hypothetical protein